MNDRDLDAIRGVALPDVMAAFGDDSGQVRGNKILALCPFHDDHNPSFSGFVGQGGRWFFRCHAGSCGAAGDVVDYVGRKLFGPSWSPRNREMFREVLRWFYDHQGALGISLAPPDRAGRVSVRPAPLPPSPLKRRRTPPPPPEEVRPTPQIQRVWAWAAAVYAELLFTSPTEEAAQVRAYLRSRGFSEETLRKGRFGLAPLKGPDLRRLGRIAGFDAETLISAGVLREGQHDVYPHFRGRIVFAEMDRAGNPVYLLGRILPGLARQREAAGKPVIKYLGLPNFTKPVLGLDNLPARGAVFLVEGPWDAWLIRQWGFAAVAISGAKLSETQIRRLLRLDRPLIPVPDNDKAGEEALAQWREALPVLRPPLRLPDTFKGEAVKDVGDLAKIPEGPAFFKRAAARLL